MSGGVNSIADMTGVDDLVEDTARNVRMEPGSVENEKLAKSSRTVNCERAPPATTDAGACEKGADASVDVAKESDPDVDVSTIATIYHTIRANVECPLS
jgi:hypothetical protein